MLSTDFFPTSGTHTHVILLAMLRQLGPPSGVGEAWRVLAVFLHELVVPRGIRDVIVSAAVQDMVRRNALLVLDLG